MKKISLAVLSAILMCGMAWADKVYIIDDDHVELIHDHIRYILNTQTKEATVGDGLDYQGNAMYSPAIWDEDYDENDNTNYWSDLIIPAEVTYNSEAYTVTSIAWRAFGRTTYVKKITLPETISNISNEAFYWCVNLEEINIPQNVRSIEINTFVLCRKLKSITMSDNIEYIGDGAFSDCQSLEAISIPGKCTRIGNDAFKWCISQETLRLEDGTENLDCGYSYETSLDYGGQDQPRYRGEFADCPIKKLYIGRNLSFPTIGNVYYHPFYTISNYCKPVTASQIPTGKTYTSVEFGDCVEFIPDELFWHSYIKNDMVLPKNLKSIGNSAFAGISGGGDVLAQNDIVFPSSLEAIGNSAFANNRALRFVKCEGIVPPAVSTTSFGIYASEKPMFIVLDGYGSVYRNAENWNNYRIIDNADELVTINVKKEGTLYDRLLAQDVQLHEVSRIKLKGTLNSDDWSIINNMSQLYDIDLSELNIESLPEGQFTDNNYLYKIKLPESLTAIDNSAFSGCTHLSGIISIPASCIVIGNNAFYKTCIEGINNIGTLSIGDYAFSWCPKLNEVKISAEGSVIHQYAFYGSSLRKLTIGRGVTVENNVCDNTPNFEELVLEDGVERLGDKAFEQCSIKSVQILGRINNLGDRVFRNCLDLEYVHVSSINHWLALDFQTLQSNPLYYGAKLYIDEVELKELDVPEGFSKISVGAFYGCGDLKCVNFPSSIETICEAAFSGCNNLEEINLPENLTSIGSNAFFGCTSLTEIDFPRLINSIGSNAFRNCSNIEEIVAHWDNPISVDNTLFLNVSNNCYLYVPIGTATKYVNAGWSVPNMRAAGILHISANDGGVVSCDDVNVTDSEGRVFFTPYKSIYVDVTPNDGYAIKKVMLNGENVISQVEDGKLFLEEPEENMMLSIIFADASIEQGDVNGDGTINQTDVISIAKYILKTPPHDFYDYWGDINNDGIINITDAIFIISKYLNK